MKHDEETYYNNKYLEQIQNGDDLKIVYVYLQEYIVY